MLTEFATIFLAILFALPLGMLIYNNINKIISRPTAQPTPISGPKPKLPDFLEEINVLVKLEVLAIIEVPQAVKEIPLIQDFQETQNEIIHNIVESFSSRMWLYANACGITRKYLIVYITRRVHAEMLDFMEDNNYSLTTEEDKNRKQDFLQKVKSQFNIVETPDR